MTFKVIRDQGQASQRPQIHKKSPFPKSISFDISATSLNLITAYDTMRQYLDFFESDF